MTNRSSLTFRLVHAKKMVQARKIIAEGCENCPNSEDVWFHAAELNVS